MNRIERFGLGLALQLLAGINLRHLGHGLTDGLAVIMSVFGMIYGTYIMYRAATKQ